MTIRHLKTFIKVAELLSISKAAEYFMVAQPSISETIKQLEEYYGVLLFERKNKTLIITKEGEELLTKAKEVVESFDEFEEIANKEDRKVKIRIGSTITFSQELLHALIDELENKFKDKLDITIKIDTPLCLEKDLTIGNVDVIFTEKLPESKSLNVIEVAEDGLAIIASTNYEVPNKIKMVDLLKYKLIVRETSSPSRYMLENELEKIGKRLTNIKVESISNAAIIKFVLRNYGLGVIPYFSVKTLINNGELREIKMDKVIERKLYIITNKNKQAKGITKQVLTYSESFLKTVMQ